MTKGPRHVKVDGPNVHTQTGPNKDATRESPAWTRSHCWRAPTVAPYLLWFACRGEGVEGDEAECGSFSLTVIVFILVLGAAKCTRLRNIL